MAQIKRFSSKYTNDIAALNLTRTHTCATLHMPPPDLLTEFPWETEREANDVSMIQYQSKHTRHNYSGTIRQTSRTIN